MIVRRVLSIRRIFHYTWKQVLLMLVNATIAAWLWGYHDHIYLQVSALPITILGGALAILLSFRNNSAYERWWEARRLWGAVVNDSRALARQVLTFFGMPAEGNVAQRGSMQKELVYRQIAFAHALRLHLRKQEFTEELRPFLKLEELEKLKNEQNVPNALLQQQAAGLQEAVQAGYIDDFRHMQIDSRLNALGDSLGGCERIKNTVFPRQYSAYATVFTWVFLILLPYGLVKELGWLTVPAAVTIGFLFLVLQSVGDYIENPFENTINDIPMTAISRTIEINLRQALGETHLPPPVQPVDGFLY